ncbi:hypothetical protein ROZALSC1DRAFT_24617 [Rozella allomycis CSF55]|uniref:F-BAR domain-containing protein n=1 Tax=Rozella allomycis (strain CSF55) TaxID=988480 RepID=A0A4P9YDR7_ROZAC|nr:hypothetical protein ROZALSC1DRAFT_24617 [Rozella allomycis CSF55]
MINVSETLRNLDSSLGGNISLINDYRDFFREKINLDKEYGLKLQALSKKHISKAEKTGNSSKFDHVWLEILRENENLGGRFLEYSKKEKHQVNKALKAAVGKLEALRKKQQVFSVQVYHEKDQFFRNCDKLRTIYQTKCLSLDAARQKYEKCPDDKQMPKLKRLWQNEVAFYNNAKNDYFLSIEKANTFLSKLENEGLMGICQIYKNIFEDRNKEVKRIFKKSCELNKDIFEVSKSESVSENIDSMDCTIDINKLYESVKVEISVSITAPLFVSEEKFDDQPGLVLDTRSKTYLVNRLIKDQEIFKAKTKNIEFKQNELEGLFKLLSTYTDNPQLGNIDSVQDVILYV